SDNQISLPSTIMANGALGIDVASLVAGSSVSGDTVNLTGGTGVDIGNSIGIVESFDQGAVTVSGNTISGYANGVEVVSDGASGDTASADIGDGTDPNANIISGDGVGILVTGSNATADINDNS